MFDIDPSSEPPPRLLLDIAGVCSGASYIPSPNCDERPMTSAYRSW
jgi:hypothetical protein